MSEYSDLEAFDDDFTPSQSGYRPGLEAVADGNYDWTILHATLDLTQRTQDRILRLELRCEQTAQVIEYPYFLRGQPQVDRLGGDLSTLGFDVGTWNSAHGKKFSVELPKAITQLPGIRFNGTKKTNSNKDNPEKPYHNLFLNARLPSADPALAEQNSIPF